MSSPALGSPYSDAVVADGPRGYWRLGDAASPAVDASGLGSPGTYNGGVVLGVTGALPGEADTAARLDGVNDLVTMGDPASGVLDFGTGDFSIELWARTPVNGERTLAAKRGSGGGSWLLTVTDDSGHAGQIRAGVSDGVTGRQVYSTRGIDDGAWHHVVVVVDRDSALRFYVDGLGAGEATNPPSGSVSNTGAFQLGKVSGYAHLSGDLDEVAVYGTALTAEQVAAHYGAAEPDIPATVTVMSGPPDPSSSTDATFSFFASEPASFECSLDGGAYLECVSPHGYTGLAEGAHVLRVRAIDLGGQTGPATSYLWRVDLVPPPAPTITAPPRDPSNDPDDTISFAGESGASFLCRLDTADFAACSSPFHYTALVDGAHVFEVKARDAAGNEGLAATASWLLDTVPPASPLLTGAPPNPSASGDAEFTFALVDGVGLLCRFNGSAFAPCTSPQTFTGLPDGQHVFDVRSVDEAGNGSEPVRFSWTIETGPPEPTIDSGPPSLTTGTAAELTFSDEAPDVTFQCSIDGSAFAACTSPHGYAGLGDGTHEFEVKAFFATGADSPAATYLWSIDTIAPAVPTIISGPTGSTTSAVARVDFSDGGDPPVEVGGALPAPLPDSTGAVHYVSPSGSDAGPGTLAQPWQTVQKALDTLQPGERALVREGVYEQNLRINRAGTPAATVTVEAYPGERAVLRPSTASPSFPIRITSEGAYVRVRGFVIEDAKGSTTAGVYVSNTAHHIELSGNEIRNSESHGILLDGGTSFVHIVGNHIHHNGSLVGSAQDHGIYFQGSDHLAADNVIHDQPFGFGIQVFDENHRSIVAHNTIVANGKSGIVLGGAVGVDGIRVIGNVLAFNSRYGIGHDALPPTNSQASHNVIFGNGDGAFDPAGTGIDFSGGNVLADPRFASLTARDLRLLSDSPALEAARAEYARPLDHRGGSRTLGGVPDIGALEAAVRFECSLDGAGYQACASPSEYSGLAEGTHTFLVRSLDDAGNAGAPAEVAWTVDPLAPTAVISGPLDPDNDPAPTFTLVASEQGATFECALDSAEFTACVSPQTYGGLADGPHVFAARATDGAGNVGPASTHSWTLDTVAPLPPAVDSGPPALTASGSAELVFSSVEPGVSFRCSLDGAAASPCSSPVVYGGLADGGHSFGVEALDEAGNAGPAATATWTVDSTEPAAPVISAGPPPLTSSRDAELAFSGGEPDLAFACSLDGGAASPCASPVFHSGLADGLHVFEVTGRDNAGNESVAASRVWTVDGTPPAAPVITLGPPPVAGSSSATFVFSHAEPGVRFVCRLDLVEPADCVSPVVYAGVLPGDHAFSVRALDPAGNESAAATYAWAFVQAGSAYESAVLADAPHGYWRLGESGVPTAGDASGFGSPGTYLGGVGLGVTGALLGDANPAAHFDGSNDLIGMGDPPSGALDFGTGDFSLELWARTTANGERTLIAKRASSGPSWLVTVTDDPGQAGHLRTLVTAGTATRQVYSLVRVDDGAWHHLVVVFDRDAGVGFYVDGLAAGFSAGALTGTVSNAAAFQLGKTSGYAYFTGDLDEVAVYATALEEARIRAHHDAARS
jgi:hypothetical protein